MQLTDKNAKKFLKAFSSLFTKDFLIHVAIKRVPNYGDLLHITVSKPNHFGVGEEHITADFALKMIKEPKELETYYKRWVEGFKNPTSTLTTNGETVWK